MMGNNSQLKGMLKRLGVSPSLARAAIASSSRSTSWKFSAMRALVTDLGMTVWPPIWDQARMTWAGVTVLPCFLERLSATAWTSGVLTSRGKPLELLPKAE